MEGYSIWINNINVYDQNYIPPEVTTQPLSTQALTTQPLTTYQAAPSQNQQTRKNKRNHVDLTIFSIR